MLTVFSTILPIIAEEKSNKEKIAKLIKYPPVERLAIGLDMIGDNHLLIEFHKFIEHYEFFLKTKEKMGSKLALNDHTLDKKTRKMAREFSDFLFKCLTHKNINHDYIKYLVL